MRPENYSPEQRMIIDDWTARQRKLQEQLAREHRAVIRLVIVIVVNILMMGLCFILGYWAALGDLQWIQ